jgi:D-galactarolactone cycloisomerase
VLCEKDENGGLLKMMIRKIECFHLFAPFDRKLGNSLIWFEGKSAIVIKVQTEEGIIGYGEAYTIDSKNLFEVMKSLNPHLTGFFFETWEDLEKELSGTMNEKIPARIQSIIKSALNIAYWDIKGKVANKPLCELFGQKLADGIPIYGTGLFYREVSCYKEQLPFFLEEMQSFIEAGYHGIKMKAGRYPVEQETWLIEKVRKELPPAMSLMVDSNCGMRSKEETKELIKRLEQMNVTWLEEPFSPDDYTSYQEVCHEINQLPIAAGENEWTWDGFTKLKDSGVLILQPELSLCGGFSKIPDIINFAKEHRLQLTPHVWGSGILYAATLHFYSLLSEHSLPYECPFYIDPLRDNCFQHLRVSEGFISTSNQPGLGIEVVDEEFNKYVAYRI